MNHDAHSRDGREPIADGGEPALALLARHGLTDAFRFAISAGERERAIRMLVLVGVDNLSATLLVDWELRPQAGGD
jgi:hypothetical protein